MFRGRLQFVTIDILAIERDNWIVSNYGFRGVKHQEVNSY